jgi:hypothetical protein
MEMNEKRLLVAKHKQQLFNYLIDRYVFLHNEHKNPHLYLFTQFCLHLW